MTIGRNFEYKTEPELCKKVAAQTMNRADSRSMALDDGRAESRLLIGQTTSPETASFFPPVAPDSASSSPLSKRSNSKPRGGQ